MTLATAADVIRYVWRHPANSGQRTRALLRAVSFQAGGRVLGRRAIARLGERSRLWVDLHRTAAAMALYANPPDMPEMRAWRRALASGGLFIDVGANIGTYTIWAAELGAEVIALEPAADTFEILRREHRAERIPGDRAAGTPCRRPGCGTARFTAGLDAGNTLAASGRGPVQANMVTLDSLIGDRRVGFGLKVDVEGFEIDVLRGCARALAGRRIGLIQLEWNQMSRLAVGIGGVP